MLQGAHITKFQAFPSIMLGRFFWGYILYVGGHPTWLTMAAPYFCDLLTLPLFSWLALREGRRMPHWLWVNVFVLGVVSPLANTLYNYQNAVIRHRGDVFALSAALPHWAVHTAFLTAIVLLGSGTWATMRSGKIRWTTKGIPKP